MSVKNITVDHDNEGRRVDNFLFLILKIYLNQKSTKLLEKEKLELIQRVKPDTKLSKNDLIRIRLI